MRISWVIPAMFISLVIGGLMGYGWTQTTTDEEAEKKQVKSVIDQAIKAVNTGDLKLLMAQYADDAKIDSKVAGAKVSKSAYAQAMSRSFQQGTISTGYSGLKVSLVDATHAVAEGTLWARSSSGGGFSSRHEWKLEKRDGRWLIVETNYKK